VRQAFSSAVFGILLAATAAVQAGELKVISGNGARAAVIGLVATFDRKTGHRTTIDFAVNPESRSKIEKGQAFDVAVLNPPVLDELIKKGLVADKSRVILGRAGIGVGVREGAPKPDISTVAAFKRTLLSARSVAYAGEGASGRYFTSLVQRLGIVEEMKPRMRPMSAEYNVEGVAAGEHDLVVIVSSRMSGVPGIQYVGRIPQELQTWIGFAAGMNPRTNEPEAARAMLKFFTSPDAAGVLKANGVEPFVE
jgi:molybdate transport system substrate-binding protein